MSQDERLQSVRSVYYTKLRYYIIPYFETEVKLPCGRETMEIGVANGLTLAH